MVTHSVQDSHSYRPWPRGLGWALQKTAEGPRGPGTMPSLQRMENKGKLWGKMLQPRHSEQDPMDRPWAMPEKTRALATGPTLPRMGCLILAKLTRLWVAVLTSTLCHQWCLMCYRPQVPHTDSENLRTWICRPPAKPHPNPGILEGPPAREGPGGGVQPQQRPPRGRAPLHDYSRAHLLFPTKLDFGFSVLKFLSQITWHKKIRQNISPTGKISLPYFWNYYLKDKIKKLNDFSWAIWKRKKKKGTDALYPRKFSWKGD